MIVGAGVDEEVSVVVVGECGVGVVHVGHADECCAFFFAEG